MLTYIFEVFVKVIILFLMIAVGYLCGKKNVITEDGAGQMSSVLFYVITPCLIVSSLQNAIGQVSMKSLAQSGLLSFVGVLVCVLCSLFLFPKSSPERKKVLCFAAAYPNAGFMGLPLVQAVLGNEGAVYASVFIAMFNLLVWTHGYSLMSSSKKIPYRRLVLNPGILGFAAGILLFLFSCRLPEILLGPITYFAGMNTPLAMLVVGVYISRVPFRSLFCDKNLYQLCLLRLLVIPAVCFAVLFLFHADRTVFVSAVILCSAPTAANTVMFAAQFGGDTGLSSRAVALVTLFSMLTMPLFPALANMLCR